MNDSSTGGARSGGTEKTREGHAPAGPKKGRPFVHMACLSFFLQLNESEGVGLHLQRDRTVIVSRREDLRVETYLVRQMACRVSQ